VFDDKFQDFVTPSHNRPPFSSRFLKVLAPL